MDSFTIALKNKTLLEIKAIEDNIRILKQIKKLKLKEIEAYNAHDSSDLDDVAHEWMKTIEDEKNFIPGTNEYK